MQHPNVSYPSDSSTPKSHLPFSPCVVVGDIVYVSGQASVDMTGKIIVDTFEGEFRRSMENMKAILKAAGTDLSHVFQTRNYIGNDLDLAEYNTLYREYFPVDPPARTTIVNCLGTALKYEVECIAIKPASTKDV
jgi:2-iminobutanoate/2-iminopropanoate deaminase